MRRFALGLAALAAVGATLPARADYPIMDEQLTTGTMFRARPLTSEDGTRIVYDEWAYRSPGVLRGTVQARLHDRTAGTDRVIARLPDGSASWYAHATAFSGNGERVALLSYERLTDDAPVREAPYAGIYLHDVPSDRTTFIAVASEMFPQGIASLSRDGRLAAGAGPSYHPLIVDLSTDTTTVLEDASLTTLVTIPPAISADGSTVVFTAWDSPGLDARDTNGFADVYTYDVETDVATLISVTTDGGVGDDDSFDALVSSNGRVVAFSSAASELTVAPSCFPQNAPADLRCRVQIYARDSDEGSTELISASTGGVPGEEGAEGARISSDGRFVVFTTRSSVIDPTNELPSAWSGRPHVRDRARMTTLPMLSVAHKAMPFLDMRGYTLSGDGRTLVYTASTLLGNDRYDVYASGNPSAF